MTDNIFEVGDIVLALAGRDEKKLFAVIEIIDGSYVFIADGKSRKTETPKKKKIKHIKLVKKAEADYIQGLNLKNGKFTNSVLRKMLGEYSDNIKKAPEN